MGNTFSCCSNVEESPFVLPRVEDVSHLDELISFIEARLNVIDKPEEGTSSAQPNTTSIVVTFSIDYGYRLLENVLKRARKHSCKILFGENRKAVIDILKGISQINWVVAGLGVVAYVLDQIDKISTNKNDCVQFLRYMCGLAKQIKQLDNHLEHEKLKDVVAFIVNGSFFCISRMQDNNLSRFFSASVDAQELKGLQSRLAQTYPDLTLDAVIQILNRIPITLPPTQGQDPNAVGIDEARARVIKLLDLGDQSTKRGVVLYGVGGIGKTTLATAVFCSLDLKAYKYCRVNIQQDCSDVDLRQLQEQVLSDLFAQKIQVRNCDEGKEHLHRCFSEATFQPIFLFIDNALRGSDLAKLLPEDLSCLSNGSRLLITTRKLNETDMIEEGGIKHQGHSVNYLSDAASRKLLSLKVLGSPDKDFDKTLDIDGLVKLCGGVPLVLELVGSMWRKLGNDVRACESIIDFLKDTVVKGEGDLSEKIVDAVYNTLQENLYKDAFLDIAAYFNNWSQQSVSCIVGDVALKALQDAALVRINEEEEVIVHDIIQARGRKLSEGYRITNYQSLQCALQDTQRIEKLKGIWLPAVRSQDAHEFQLQPKHMDYMKSSLRVLCIERYELDGVSNKAFTNEGSLPDGFDQLKSLRFLRLESFQDLKRLPESFGNLSALKKLILVLSDLKCLPDSFGQLSRLEELGMIFCHCLESLPRSFCQLSRLKKLSIVSCKRLQRLPDGFGQLKSLTHLDMSYCSLQMVSDDFGQLPSVCAVLVRGCHNLDEKAMDKLVEIKSLQVLNIKSSPNLIKRWREVKLKTHPLIIVRGNGFPFEDNVSSAIFHEERKFLHNDGDLYLAEWSPGDGQQVAFVLSICDLSSPSNRAALERVKQNIAELASQGIDIVYVSMVQNMEGIRQTLLHFPNCGTHAWIAPDERSNKLIGFSICILSVDNFPFGRVVLAVEREHTLITRAVVSVDEEGEKHLRDFQLVTSTVDGGAFKRFFFPFFQMMKFAVSSDGML